MYVWHYEAYVLTSEKSPTSKNLYGAIAYECKIESIGIHTFWSTLWTKRGESCSSVLNNHEGLS